MLIIFGIGAEPLWVVWLQRLEFMFKRSEITFLIDYIALVLQVIESFNSSSCCLLALLISSCPITRACCVWLTSCHSLSEFLSRSLWPVPKRYV